MNWQAAAFAIVGVQLLFGHQEASAQIATAVSEPGQSGASIPIVSVPQGLIGLAECPRTGMVVKTTLRIVIPKDLSDSFQKKRLVTESSATVTGDDEDLFDDKSAKINKAVTGDAEFAKNPYHITVSTIPVFTNETHLRVRVVLRNTLLKFMSDATRAPKIEGVAYESRQPEGNWLCQRASETYSTLPETTTRPERNVLTFFIKRGERGIASINFLIGPDPAHGATSGNETPILIDPRIKNDG